MSNLCVYDPLATYITPYRKDAMNCVSTEDYANRDILDNAHVETQFIASYHLDLIYCALPFTPYLLCLIYVYMTLWQLTLHPIVKTQ